MYSNWWAVGFRPDRKRLRLREGERRNLPPLELPDSRDKRSGEPADQSPAKSTLHLRKERKEGKSTLGMHDREHEEWVGMKMFIGQRSTASMSAPVYMQIKWLKDLSTTR